MRGKHFKTALLVISVVAFCYHSFHLLYLWSVIPIQIPIHFSNSTPDNWGSKYLLLLMPVIGLLIWFLIGLLAKKPEKLNYVNLTEENKEIQYLRTEKILQLIRSLSFLSFILANEGMLRYSVGLNSTIPFIIAMVLLGICLVAPIYLLFWAATLKY